MPGRKRESIDLLYGRRAAISVDGRKRTSCLACVRRALEVGKEIDLVYKPATKLASERRKCVLPRAVGVEKERQGWS